MCAYLDNLVMYLKNLMTQSNWDDEHTKDWARSIFTTICLCGNIDADTDRCDGMLRELYAAANIEDVDISYDEFENFMLAYIV